MTAIKSKAHFMWAESAEGELTEVIWSKGVLDHVSIARHYDPMDSEGNRRGYVIGRFGDGLENIFTWLIRRGYSYSEGY